MNSKLVNGSEGGNGLRLTPFLKWAGGKRWLVEKHPTFFQTQFDRYVEPFLGSAAVYFFLAPRRALLSDANHHLVETYSVIRDEPQKVLQHLKRHQRNHGREYYYFIRDSRPRSKAGRAAKFIYLNRTCWNGLYRVNLQGVFNVPLGTKSNVLLDSDDFHAVSEQLSRARIQCCDFEKTLARTRQGDFVFVDPPYTVKHNNNGFIKYNEGLFSWDDQVRLRDCVVRARDNGAKILVTNANNNAVRDLYQGVGRRFRLTRNSVIGGTNSARGEFEEMLVKCF